MGVRTWFPGSALLVLVLVAGGCADTGGEAELAKPAFDTFRFGVYPVLLRDCGFPACHGPQDRFFRMYGPGRVREDPDAEALEQPTLSEANLALRMAQSMIDPDDLDASPLLRKPLSVAAGGDGHGGVDAYDRDVYRTKQDHGYTVIRRWVFSLQEQAQAQAQQDAQQPAGPATSQP